MPFDVARIGKDGIAIDATDKMLQMSAQMPDQTRVLSEERYRDNVFVVFGVTKPVYVYER